MSMVKPVIYQLVVRYFGNTNTTNRRNGTLAANGCGRFADVNARALAGLKALGVTHVWLTGCLRQATLTDYSALGLPADPPDVVKGVAGSLYAVRDYFDVCPDYATDPVHRLAEFEALVGRIHRAGMKVLIDFVPNHVARGYHSVVHPEWDFGVGDDQSQFFARDNHFFYLAGKKLRLRHPEGWDPPGVRFTGEFAPEDGGPGRAAKVTGDNCASPEPGVHNWYEAAKLNYGFDFTTDRREFEPRPRTWVAMDRILAYWQGRGVDGFRCDMAYYVPAEAWRYLIGRARARDPGCLLLAESYPGGGGAIPIRNLDDLIACGFDAFYHSDAYNALKRIYQGRGTQEAYEATITPLTAKQRAGRVGYLENHDERRVAAPVDPRRGPGDSGFGGMGAGYQLAPLQLLFGPGPVLLFNGQEAGEPGAGAEGFSSADGRTTTFDYWCMPEFVKWVNGHSYDGGGLSEQQRDLRRFYADLLALCQDPCVTADGYWGLKYFNGVWPHGDCPEDFYTFARYREGGGELLLVCANFRPAGGASGRLRVPVDLAVRAGLPDEVNVTLVLDRGGAQDLPVARLARQALVRDGFAATVANQSAYVYRIGR